MRPLSLPVLEVHQSLGIRALPRRRPCVVIHVVDASPRVTPNLPAVGQRRGSLPVRGSGDVIDVVPPAVRIEANLPAGGQRFIVPAALRRLQLFIARVGHWRRIARPVASIWYLLRVVVVVVVVRRWCGILVSTDSGGTHNDGTGGCCVMGCGCDGGSRGREGVFRVGIRGGGGGGVVAVIY